jgi:5-formyltetrahydrofolate cyclo-ligase
MGAFKEDKKELRKAIRRRIAGLSKQERSDEAAASQSTFIAMPEWRQCSVLMAFVSIRRQAEIETEGLIRRAAADGKRLALPRIRGKELEFRLVEAGEDGSFSPPLVPHPYGVQEPPDSAPLFTPDPAELTLAVIPGLAFDRAGGRLGRGKGYYDGWLSRFRSHMDRGRLFPVAFGYSVQLVEQVPMDEGDVFLPRLVLGGELIETTET